MISPALKFLKQKRLALNYSQNDIAKLLGISRQYYGFMETGKSPIPKKMRGKLMISLKLTTEEIMEFRRLERVEKTFEDFIALITDFYNTLPSGSRGLALEKLKIFMEQRKK